MNGLVDIDFGQWEAWEQSDGAVWHVHEVEGGELVVTSKGQELMKETPEVQDYMGAYLHRAIGGTALPGALETRAFIASGARSGVYEMTPEVAVKEAHKTGSPIYALRRMDRLVALLEGGAPRWIDIPHIYAVLHSKALIKDFIFQQKIDSGVTVEWILNPENAADYQLEAIEREFGEVDADEQLEIKDAYEEAEGLIEDVLHEAGETAKDYLIDYHPGNVLVKRLSTPVAGKNHKLWLIDQ